MYRWSSSTLNISVPVMVQWPPYEIKKRCSFLRVVSRYNSLSNLDCYTMIIYCTSISTDKHCQYKYRSNHSEIQISHLLYTQKIIIFSIWEYPIIQECKHAIPVIVKDISSFPRRSDVPNNSMLYACLLIYNKLKCLNFNSAVSTQ